MKNLLAFMAMLPCIAVAQLPDYVPTSGLAAWFDFTQGIEDLSPNQVTLQLHGGAEQTGESIVTNGLSSWAETVNLTTNFQGDPEFTVIILARRTGNFTFGSPWGLGGGIDVDGQQRTNMNSWCNNFTNGIQLDLWGSHTLSTGQTYSSENFQAVVWRKSGIGFSSQTISISLNDSNNFTLSQQRGSGTGYPNLPDTSRFFLGKAGLENNYYAPMEFRAAGLFDRPLTDEEVNLLISNLLIEGCTDSNACNFNENALSEDGSCVSCEVLAQACGEGTVWDSASSTCVPAILSGEIAEVCTVMNLQELAQNHLLLVDQLATADSLLAVCNGTSDAASNSTFNCGDPLTYWNYDYATVLIGDQCWFAENLRNEKYANGDFILTALNDSEWSSTNEGASTVYGEGISTCLSYSPNIDDCDELASLSTYGRLYNWFAVDDARGLCPAGWHVPSADEWNNLAAYISNQGFTGIEGAALKATSGWNNNGNGFNEFGFSGLPGGFRHRLDGQFVEGGNTGYYFTSTFNTYALYRRLYSGSSAIISSSAWPRSGLSVRCIQD